jgi:hypothetical protein
MDRDALEIGQIDESFEATPGTVYESVSRDVYQFSKNRGLTFPFLDSCVFMVCARLALCRFLLATT